MTISIIVTHKDEYDAMQASASREKSRDREKELQD